MNLSWIDLLALIGSFIFIFAIYFTTWHFVFKSNKDDDADYESRYKLNQHLKRHYYLSPFALELENKWFNHYLEQKYKYFFGGFLYQENNETLKNLEKENQELKEKVSELEEKVLGIYNTLGEISLADCVNEDLTEKLKQENEKLKTKIKTYKNKTKVLDNKKEIKKQRKTRGAC